MNRRQLRKFINRAIISEKNNKVMSQKEAENFKKQMSDEHEQMMADSEKLFSGPTRVDSGPPAPDPNDPFSGPTRIDPLPTHLKNKDDSPLVGGETLIDDKNKMVNLEQLNDYLDQMKATTKQFYRMNRSEIEKIAKKLKDVERVLIDFIDEMDQA